MFSSGNMYVFVTLTHKIYQTRQTHQTPVNPYPYPPKPGPLAKGKGMEGKGRGTAEIPQGYPCQSLAAGHLTRRHEFVSSSSFVFQWSW